MKKTKKAKKAIASLAIASMAITMVPFNALATVPTRLAGTTAEQTAAAIADQTGYTGTAILASSTSYGMVDALTAGPLAAALKAPILLTGAGDTLNADTKAELTKLNVNKVYVTSGTAVIKQGVIDELKAMNIEVVALGGFDRAETSVNIAEQMTGVTKVAVANGLADALSIGSVAAAANQPILLTDKDAVPASVSTYLNENSAITASDVIGGTGIISDAVKDKFPGATRHFGYTAYDTNKQVIQDFEAALKFDNVYVANGVTGIDALAGAPLAAQTKSPIVLTDGKTVPAVAQFTYGKNANAAVTALGGEAVVPETVRTGVAAGQVTPVQGDLAVTSVSAISANSFNVVFNQAPADTSKVTFAVTRGTTPITTTVAWNTAKTEATVASSINFPEGTYTVVTKNDTVELSSNTVSITQQKVAKINFTSTTLAVAPAVAPATLGNGYATYQVLDQYGNDITTSYLANNISFQSGVGTVTGKNGLLTIVPTMNLIQFSTVVISASDTNSGISASATLTTSTALGTLSDMELNQLTNDQDKVLTAEDTTTVFYIDYTATDLSGNPTKDYNLVKNGLILSGAAKDELTTSNSYVTAKVVQDPSDSTKAAIQVRVVNNTPITMDLPLSITAMTYTGKTSTLDTTLKKAAAPDTITLMAPSYDIAVNETKEIPFEVYDQYGVKITKFSDLNGVITFNGGAAFAPRVDGTAKLMVTAQGTKGPQIITANTPTGKMSTLTLNIVEAAKADTLTVDSNVLVSAMQVNATQSIDFGFDKGGLSVKDQYGRAIDMIALGANNYEVRAVVAAADTGILSTAGTAKGGVNNITFTAVAPGTATVTLELYDSTAPATVINSKSVSLSVMKNDDIKNYTITTVDEAIYANASSLAAPNFRDWAYEANPKVYGATAGGAKVVLAGTPIIGAYVDNTDEFAVDTTNYLYTTANKYDSVRVIAGLPTNNKTEASTNLTITLTGVDNKVYSLTTPIKSSTIKPVAKSLVADVDTKVVGITVNATGDIITVDKTKVLAGTLAVGDYMQRYSKDGALGEADGNRAEVHFYAVDSYGTWGMYLPQVMVVAADSNFATGTFALDADGKITTNTLAAGDYVTITAVTNNGLIKTIRIEYI